MFQRPAVTQRISYVLRKDENRNAHLLGVNALALDTTTLTANPPPNTLHYESNHNERRHHSHKYHVPGGILYTGGRDGMIAAWDLHFEGLPPSTFRQSFNHHTDWVNDIVLCHNGETLVSASSDRTVKLVRPHSRDPTSHIIGTHGDYVKTLAYASGPGWVASGGLDKTVNIWDIKEGRSGQFASLGSIPETSSKASIYALACNPSGTVLATGSPEKIIRVWDPRSGQRITKFAGHTDIIRALLISESGDTILSASSDTTIKLWSLTAQRCITTFTMHSDSVWSLYSDHPELATFYGGGKDGLVTKTEINRYNPQHHGDEVEDPGQCVVICKADAGVARLVAHDNARIWTATSSSSVYQWPDIPTRANRSPEMTESIIPANLLKLNLDESTFTEPEHYYPASTVYSAASLGSVFANNRDKYSQHSSEDDEGLITPIFEEPENEIEGEHGLIKCVILNNRRMVVTEDKCGEVALWDIIKCVQLETYTGRKLDEVVNELNTVESVPTWCTVDTRIGALTVHMDEGRCFDAEVYVDEIEETPDPERPEDQRIVIGKWVLKNLFEKYIPVHIDAYDKESLRIAHQEETSVAVPTTVVTNERSEVDGQSGTQEGDPANPSNESRPTANTSQEGSKGPSSEPPASSSEGSKVNSSTTTPQDQSALNSQQQQSSGTTLSASNSPRQGPVSTSSSTAPASTGKASNSGSTLATPPVSSSSQPPPSPASAPSSSNGFMGRLKHSVKKLARTPSAEQKFENGRPTSSKKGAGNTASKQPSGPAIPENAATPAPNVTVAAATAGSGLETGAAASVTSSPSTTTVDTTTATGGLGLGLLKSEDDQSVSDTVSSYSTESLTSPVLQLPNPAISVRPPHPPFTPPTHMDCPTVEIPPHIPVIISEQSREASSSVDLYRGSVGSLGHDYVPIVQVIPTWLLEVLLKNMIPVKETPKVSFILRPHHDQEAAVAAGLNRLGELPGGTPRLTAPRMLRTRKVIGHVMEKLGLAPPKHIPTSSDTPQQDDSQAGVNGASTSNLNLVQPNNTSSSDNGSEPTGLAVSEAPQEKDATQSKPKEEEEEEEYMRQEDLRPENWLEILCNDQVLLPTTTLATIRTHYWKTGGDVVLTYRYKLRTAGTPVASNLTVAQPSQQTVSA
ncbi:hypothetical protein BGZ80_009982 [Entomortierella chlamydospora]|uniref:Wd repeat protein n=1 Tax=Entomortierella chlamydospora TaxID=101097 RepID=A0A9P6N2X5_9FUNG|nr:hypothetical protein BGZ80_009982 [Entomortierella chlamydospora]